MKRKLTSLILTIAVMACASLPASAASCDTVRQCIPLQQILQQYGCSPSCQVDLNTLLRQFLTQPQSAPAAAEKETEQEAQPEAEAPAEPNPKPEETPGASVRAFEQEVVRLVNAERARYGLNALQEDASLSRIARLKSQDMHDRGYFDHNSPTYGTPFQMLKSFGVSYRTAGENIAMGYATPEAVVRAWMNSPGHRANILNGAYTTIGVGYVASGNYWTQHFIG